MYLYVFSIKNKKQIILIDDKYFTWKFDDLFDFFILSLLFIFLPIISRNLTKNSIKSDTFFPETLYCSTP